MHSRTSLGDPGQSSRVLLVGDVAIQYAHLHAEMLLPFAWLERDVMLRCGEGRGAAGANWRALLTGMRVEVFRSRTRSGLNAKLAKGRVVEDAALSKVLRLLKASQGALSIGPDNTVDGAVVVP